MEREESGTRTVNDKEMTSLVHMETIEERGDLLNQQCSNCDGNLARHWCLDCYEALCGDCVTAHRRVTLTRSHRLLNQPCNDDRFRPPIKFCKLHPPEPLRLFCFTCNHLTCRDCQLLAHKNHRFSFANEAVDGLRKKLDACMQPIRAQMEASRKSLQDMEMRLKVLARSELHLTNSLQEVFRSLSELLKARLERLTREIQTIYDLEREMIKGRMLKVKELQEGHRSVREAADKAQNSRDLLVVLRCVEQVTSQVKDLKDQDLSPPSNMVYLKVTTDRQTVESMIRFGKLLLSWVPFCVSKEFKESVEPHPASSTSSPTSQPLTSSIIQPLTSSSNIQPLTSSSISQPLTSSPTSQPLTSSSISQPLKSSFINQLLTSTSKTSNGISGPASCPVSLTTSSSLDSSNLLTFSSKIIPQTGTSREAASNQQRPPLLSLSDLVPPLVCPSPPPGPSTRTGKSSGAKSLPASAEPSSSGSLSSQVRLPPSSTCPPPSKSHVSITPNALVSSVCPSSSSLTFVVPLSSSFSSSNVLDPVPTCLIGSRSQSTSEPLGPPLVIAPTNYRLLHQFLDNQNPPPPLFVSSSLQVSPLSCVPPASEPPPFRASTTSGSDSIRINILSKSQLMSESEPLCRRWFTPGMWDIVPTVSLRSSSSAGPIASSVRRQNHKASSSSRTPSASTQKDTQQLHLPAPQTAAPPSSSSTVGTDSTLPPSGGAFFLAAVPQTQTPILVTDQKRSTHSRCAASDHQLLLDQNPASSPSHFNDQHQDLSLDKTTSVSKPGTAESGETRIEEDVSSPVTPDIQPTSEFTNPAEEKSPPEDHEVKPSVHPGDTQLYGGLFSPISSEDELFSKDPEESNPAEECFILKESEDIQPHGEPFSPVSSEDRLTTINPEETKPSERPEAGEFEWATSESEEMKPYSPISSVDEIITPEETRPAGRLFTEVQPATNTPDEDRVGLFPPVSSEDELSFPFTKAADLKLNISEMSDRDTEAPQSLQTRQRAFVLAHMQPRVSLMRLPVSLTDRTRLLPSFEVVLGDDDNIIHLKEPHVSNVSDEDSDVTEDFTKSGSSDSPMSVEVLSCSACLSPSASKICSMCGRGYHVDCHVPPVGPDIWSEWICSLCQDLSDPSDPYSSDRPKSLQGTGLSPLDQRRCETLLLHLKVEGCRRFSELDLWSDVVLISERLTHHRPPPYQTAAQLVSDLWTLFLDSSQSEELEKLQQSFLKKLKETLGAELPASLLVAPTSDKASGEGPSCSVSGTEMPREQGDFKDVRKRLRDFLGLKFSSASKRTKKH
uniref:Flocculation protein FLO11-like n=1 Tax=Nothobranchius furzeri TaxID=105023 RepID=A0A8C6LL95_NOTFU